MKAIVWGTILLWILVGVLNLMTENINSVKIVLVLAILSIMVNIYFMNKTDKVMEDNLKMLEEIKRLEALTEKVEKGE